MARTVKAVKMAPSPQTVGSRAADKLRIAKLSARLAASEAAREQDSQRVTRLMDELRRASERLEQMERRLDAIGATPATAPKDPSRVAGILAGHPLLDDFDVALRENRRREREAVDRG